LRFFDDAVVNSDFTSIFVAFFELIIFLSQSMINCCRSLLKR
jgi:hypothetical protein